MFGHRVALDIEYLEIAIGARDRRVERLDFVEAGARYTKRLAELVSALCRHLPISAVSRWTGLAWRTVKDMDRDHLRATWPALNPRDIVGVRLLGVDEVARAKGHDYVTVVYDLESGHNSEVAVILSVAKNLASESAHAREIESFDALRMTVGCTSESIVAVHYQRKMGAGFSGWRSAHLALSL